MELDVLVAELNGKLERMVDGIEVVKRDRRRWPLTLQRSRK